MAKGSSTTLLLFGGIAAAIYFYRTQLEAELATLGISIPGLSPTSATTATPAQATNTSPITAATPGAVAVGTQGCFSYAGMVSCPAGVSPPAGAAPQNNCQTGYSVDASGVCTLYSDAQLLAGLNSIQWSGSTAIPTEQITRIDPQILAQYGASVGVNPGTVLAYMLGLGGSGSVGQTATGTDGNIYNFTNDGTWQRSSPTTKFSAFPVTTIRQLDPHPVRVANPLLRGLGRLGRLAAALPITNSILTEASHNPHTAALVGSDPRALLTVPQWNYFYAQASGIVQTIPQHPAGEPGAKVNAATYHDIRQAAGLPVRLGTLRPSAPGAFPLGGISDGPARVPYVFPGNRNIYRIPGRGAVPARRNMGLISNGGGNHRWSRSPFPRPADWREAQ
jgi:hypothetical protein